MTLSAPRTGTPEILTLHPDDVSRLGRITAHEARHLRTMLEACPDRSVWAPDTLEYLVVNPWRHRAEISQVHEIAAVRHAEALLAGARERCQAAGDAMFLAIELHDGRSAQFYGRGGLEPIEDVVTYEFEATKPRPATTGRLQFRIAHPEIRHDLAALLAIDHAAFPWLWQNSEEEFRVYGDSSDVLLLLGFDGEDPVSYAGITLYAGWGHLDRIAVLPRCQGSGFGAETLATAVDTMEGHGARRVGLSTQRDNDRSQRMYERFGFRRSPGFDYRLYGADLRSGDGATHTTTPAARTHGAGVAGG